MNKIKKYLIAGLATVSMLAVTTIVPVSTPLVSADAKSQVCDSIGGCSGGANKISNTIKNVINLLSAIAGIIAIILIIIGGIKFVTSGGDAAAAASARNTIIYALVGLVVVVFAQVIVRFILQIV